jgi:hypothetical protein
MSSAAQQPVHDPRAVDPDCYACRHFWVTHERAHPYGCRAFGIASTRIPSAEVRAASGHECRAFESKSERAST